MRKILIAIIFLLPPSSSLALDTVIEKHIPDAKLVGSGKLTKVIWDVYQAELFTQSGEYVEGKPLALKIEYLRDIKRDKIADKTVEEMKAQGFTDDKKLNKWREDMINSIPDVKDGTTITGIYTKDKNTIFYSNSKKEKIINDKEFGQKFFDIWLSPKTSEPKLRKKLLGQI